MLEVYSVGGRLLTSKENWHTCIERDQGRAYKTMYIICSCQMVCACLLLLFEVSVVLTSCTVQNVIAVKQLQINYNIDVDEIKYQWDTY